MKGTTAALVLWSLGAAAGLAAQTPKHKKPAPKSAPVQPVRLTLAPSGNEARFIVREQLVRVELPNDAIGATTAIAGEILLDGKGGVDSAGSRISVDLTTLKSDRDMRDRYIKRRTLVVDSFPTAVLVVTELRGLPTPLPTSGPLSFSLIGNLTVHGVTTPTTWEVTAEASDGGYTGRATTHLKFGDFHMDQPRVPIVLSVVDDLKLEYDFHFLRALRRSP